LLDRSQFFLTQIRDAPEQGAVIHGVAANRGLGRNLLTIRYRWRPWFPYDDGKPRTVRAGGAGWLRIPMA
jgi:hypothetical protein